MSQDIIHVYLMPGMCASPDIFEHITLPEDQFKLHYLEWLIPKGKESLEAYARRMVNFIEYEDSVLLGVSFGGVLVQEMAKYLTLKRLIIVSSVKSKSELPKHMQVAKITKAYKLLPVQLLNNIELLVKYAFGKSVEKRLELYKKYLSVNDSRYVTWAIEQMVCWEQDIYDPSLIHIHGAKDSVFPIKNIEKCITINNGTHIMIINKYKWFNENLPSIILDGSTV